MYKKKLKIITIFAISCLVCPNLSALEGMQWFPFNDRIARAVKDGRADSAIGHVFHLWTASGGSVRFRTTITGHYNLFTCQRNYTGLAGVTVKYDNVFLRGFSESGAFRCPSTGSYDTPSSYPIPGITITFNPR